MMPPSCWSRASRTWLLLSSGWAEQNPEDWFNAFQSGLKDILARHPDAVKRISAIGVTGQMIGLTILDKSGSVVRPAIIWMDQRCLPQVDRLKKDFKDLIWRRAFNPVNITYTLPKILWLEENEPDAWARLYKIQLPKDYVRLRLTGTWVMDHNDASGTLLLDVADLRWSDEIIDALGLVYAVIALLLLYNLSSRVSQTKGKPAVA